jgi:hypothetical protein
MIPSVEKSIALIKRRNSRQFWWGIGIKEFTKMTIFATKLKNHSRNTERTSAKHYEKIGQTSNLL